MLGAIHRDHHQVHIEQSAFAEGMHAILRDTGGFRLIPQFIHQQGLHHIDRGDLWPSISSALNPSQAQEVVYAVVVQITPGLQQVDASAVAIEV